MLTWSRIEDGIQYVPMVFGQDGLNLWNQESFPKQPQLMSTVFIRKNVCLIACFFPVNSGPLTHTAMPWPVTGDTSYCGLIQPVQNWAYPPYDEGYDASRGAEKLRCGPQTLQLPWLCVQAMVTVSTMRPTMAVLKRTEMRWSKSRWKPHWICARDCPAWI